MGTAGHLVRSPVCCFCRPLEPFLRSTMDSNWNIKQRQHRCPHLLQETQHRHSQVEPLVKKPHNLLFGRALLSIPSSLSGSCRTTRSGGFFLRAGGFLLETNISRAMACPATRTTIRLRAPDHDDMHCRGGHKSSLVPLLTTIVSPCAPDTL